MSSLIQNPQFNLTATQSLESYLWDDIEAKIKTITQIRHFEMYTEESLVPSGANGSTPKVALEFSYPNPTAGVNLLRGLMNVEVHVITNEIRKRPKALLDLKNRVYFQLHKLINSDSRRYAPLALSGIRYGAMLGCMPEIVLTFQTEGYDLDFDNLQDTHTLTSTEITRETGD